MKGIGRAEEHDLRRLQWRRPCASGAESTVTRSRARSNQGGEGEQIDPAGEIDERDVARCAA